MPGFIGMPELILLGLVALLVFGPKRLPEMGRGLGKGMREFKDSLTHDRPEPVEQLHLEPAPAEPVATPAPHVREVV